MKQTKICERCGCPVIPFGTILMGFEGQQCICPDTKLNEQTFQYSTLRSAVEFGFKGHEEGYNLQKVLRDFDKVMINDQ